MNLKIDMVKGGKLSPAEFLPGLLLAYLLSFLFFPSEFITKQDGVAGRIGAMTGEVCILNNPTRRHPPTQAEIGQLGIRVKRAS